MAMHATLDQETLLELWRLAVKAQNTEIGHAYICTVCMNKEQKLDIRAESGFFCWLARLVKNKYYSLSDGSMTVELLKQLHNSTQNVTEADLIKAASVSSLVREGVKVEEIVTIIKTGCQRINAILQHVMERKLEKALEIQQENVKLFFSKLFLPDWVDHATQRRAEVLRAQEELQRARSIAADKNMGIVEKIRAYLDAATAQLNVAISQKEEAELLFEQAKRMRLQAKLENAVKRVNSCITLADDAVVQASNIAKQADALVKAKEAEEKQPILNFTEIEEFKKIREIINVVGEAAEYAQEAKGFASEITRLASVQTD